MDLKTLPYWFVLAVQQGGELASGGVAGCAEFAGNSFAFFNGKDAVNRGEFHALSCARGPVNLRGAGSCAVGQAEVYAQIVRRKITAAAQHVSALAHVRRIQIYGSADRIARTARASNEFQLYPMMMIGVHVAQQNRHAIHVVDDDADLAIVEDVSEGCAARYADSCKPRPFNRRNQLKLAVLQVVIKQGTLRVTLSPFRMTIDFRVYVSIDDEQIFPSVVVVIEKSIAEAYEGNS